MVVIVSLNAGIMAQEMQLDEDCQGMPTIEHTRSLPDWRIPPSPSDEWSDGEVPDLVSYDIEDNFSSSDGHMGYLVVMLYTPIISAGNPEPSVLRVPRFLRTICSEIHVCNRHMRLPMRMVSTCKTATLIAGLASSTAAPPRSAL